MFITLEGPEGGGKTTQAQILVAWLCAQGKDVLAVREPGGTGISDAVRHILLDFGSANMDARAELLLFCASRAQLVSEKIKPHLAQGSIVVCDRFADSTLAYQGYGRGLDLQTLRQLLTFATYGLKPDLTLLLDMDVDLGLQRKAGDEEWNRLDAETVDFHRRVRSGYLALASAEPERYQIIQADLPLEQVAGQVQSTVSHALERQSHGL
jgi:dTMP kinase